MMTILRRIQIQVILVSTFFFLTYSPTDAGDSNSYKVIVHSSNSINSLSTKSIRLLFLKRIKKWENGEKVFPIDQVESSSARQEFSLEILGKKVSAVKAYWQKQIFTGRAVPPPEKRSDKEILIYVQQNRGAIGYISTNTKIDGFEVKAIQVED